MSCIYFKHCTRFLLSPALRCCSHLIVHNDLVGHCVQQRGLRDELFLGIFVLLFACLLHIVSCQSVQTCHLILFVVAVVQVPVDTRRLKEFNKVLCFALLVVLQLREDNKVVI